ncbi:hypothetical protein F3Y22_tig00110503pilonHSYRG00256 [Hibiscus syriacus]|uniref:DUF4218 domain-containing protein n=1 Tax=Hibiscus syriacus TaxID=106335 RepID=A0A6A3AGG5_HIBSY|nr:hypothetical protein F3Y22_tig00110503pilonHSYRG00256 [Hibiscus syriacus]
MASMKVIRFGLSMEKDSPSLILDALTNLFLPTLIIRDMLHDAFRDVEKELDSLKSLLEECEKPLYVGSKYNALSGLLKFQHIKGQFGWSEASFEVLLGALKDVLPLNNRIPNSLYDAKKLLKGVGLQYEKIHECENDCVLFWKEHKDASQCPTCGTSRWKKNTKNVPSKVLWYFSPIPRFRRMFSSPEMAQNLTWHAQGRAKNGMLSHPRDSPSWKLVDRTWKEFGEEKWNLSPKQPGNNIDVYLAPLIADLKLLWETGVKTYDAYKKEYFNLRAILLWTINDFPAYGNLLGCVTKGYYACPICSENTCSQWLPNSKKKKDGLRARKDLEAMGIKPKLQTQPRGNRTWLPPTCYTLNTTEKHRFYETLSTIKVPDGYCSNFKNLVSDYVSTMNCLKSNDCHVLMQQLLPFAIKGVLHVKVRKTIIEKYFPPSFFDVMIHLMVHLVREVRLCGPVHFRWMYPFERYMKTLKGYVRNHHRPEGCIAECYVAEEALEFCSDYLKNMKSIGNPHERVDERIRTGKPLSRGTVEVVDAKLLDEAHLYVLRNTADVEPYIEQHMLELKNHNPRASRNSKWLQTQHSRTFISWLKTKVDTHFANGEDICESVRWLANRPSFAIASTKDSNPVYGAVTYYGHIQEIWDLDYRIFIVPVFMCDWVDSRGIKKDDFGFTVVNFARLDHQSERFILASQAKQVFYVQDQQDANLSIVGFTPHKMYKYGANSEIDDMLEYHVVLGTMESDQSSSHDEDSKQRGPTIKGKTTKGKVIVTYNKKGVPIGVVATKLASFEGMVARSMVPITYATWRDVEQEKKEDLWQYILSRKNTLQSIRTKWKNFKHYLYKKFIEKFKNDPNTNMLNPPEMYPYLKKDEWKEISEKAKKMRGQHRYNYRLSRKGYAGLTLEIMQETGKEEDEIDRALLWKKARQMKKGVYDPNVQIVVDKMEEMQKSETLGEVICGTNDMLTQSLGTQEQRGRVRGMGKFVRPHQYFVLPNTVKKYLDGEKKKFEKRFNQIEGAIEKLQKGMNHASEGASCQGWGKADFEDNPPEELLDTSCYLAIDIASNIVAKGTIVKHNDLSGENIEVMMEMSVQGDALLPFPLDEEFIYKVKNAVGFIVKWPRHLVIRCSDLEKGEGTPKMEKEKEKEEGKGEGTLQRKKEEEKEEGTPKRERKKEKEEEGTPQRRRTRAQMMTRLRVESNRVLKVFARMVDIQLKNAEFVKVQCEDDMFGYESFTYITWEDFEVIFTVDEMTGSAITCYMMYLFEEIKNGPKRDHGICFMTPSAISPSGRKCPRQSGGTECGYYVCTFMKEIVENGLQVLVNKNVGDGKEEYTDDDIDDIRKEWKVLRFGRKGKLNPSFIGPYEILKRLGPVAFQLALSSGMEKIHDVFHVSMLRKYRSDLSHIIAPEEIEVQSDMTYEEKPVQILAYEVKQLRNKAIPLVKVLWRNHKVE